MKDWISFPSYQSGRSKLFLRIPRNLTPDLAQTLQRPITQLDRAELDHPRIQSQRLPYIILYLARRIISHNKVVAVGVLCLMFSRSLGKAEDAPVLDTANGAS